MTGAGAAVAMTATITAAQVVSALLSPLPLMILGGLAVLIWLPVAVLLLTPVWSRNPDRNAHAAAMLDRVLAAIPGSRPAPATTSTSSETTNLQSTDDVPARSRQRRWRIRQR